MDRLETEPILIRGPHLDGFVVMFRCSYAIIETMNNRK
jgi:hypothetical protein